jgi:hypothetical protein
MDPLVRQFWYIRVYEGLPIWDAPIEYAAASILGLTVGFVLLCVWAKLNYRDCPRDAVALFLLYLGCILAGALVIRTTIYALLLSGMLAAWAAQSLLRQVDESPGLSKRMGFRVIATLLLMTHLLGQNLSDYLNTQRFAQTPEQDVAVKKFESKVRLCQRADAAKALNRLPPAQLMAALDSSPSILQFTRHRVVATGHHRNDKAMGDVIRTFATNLETAKTIMRDRKIDYLIACEGSFELPFYQSEAPDGLAAALAKHEEPVWLVRQKDLGPYNVYKVDLSRVAGS